MKTFLTNYVFLVVSFLFQAATAGFILKRKHVRTFPIFFAYTIFHLIQAILSFIALRISYKVYFYEWWTGEILDTLITLAVIQELFVVTFQPYDALRKWSSRLYVVTTVLLCFLAVLTAFQHSRRDDPTIAALLTVQRSENFIEVGLLIVLFSFCQLFGLTWRHYIFGIAIGLALMGAVIVVAATVRSHLGPPADPWTRMIEPAGFTLGTAIWTYYFASARSRLPLDQVPGTERLIAWNRALGEIGRR